MYNRSFFLLLAFLISFTTYAQTQDKVYDVVIVGAGLSGLTSAHYLETENILILEKKEKAGGRVIEGEWEKFHYPKGTEYIGEPEGVLKELINDLELEVIKIPPPTDGIGYKGEIYSKNQILDFLPSKKEKKEFKKLEKELSKFDRRTDDIVWENELAYKFELYDTVSVASWLNALNIHPLIQRYIEIENLGLFSANNEELSILYNANEMAYNLPSPKYYDESEVFTFKNGMIELTEALVEEQEGKIIYNSEVLAVEKEENFLNIKVNVGDEAHIIKAKNIICATPAPIAKEILKECITKEAIAQLSKIDYGQYITINIFTKERFLKDAWTVSCLDNYFTSIYDVTRPQTSGSYDGKSIISAYIPSTSSKDKQFIYQTDSEIFNKTIQGLEGYFNGISASVIGYDIQRFKYAYPVFGKGYYHNLQDLKKSISSSKNVFLAGDYMKYAVVDGAVLSGYESAIAINRRDSLK